MKKYFTEYGHLTLAAIVVALLVAIASPVGNLIKASTTELVTTCGESTNNFVNSFEVTDLNGPTVNLISFTISGTSYQAEEGMTWEEFIDSEYNLLSSINGGKCFGKIVTIPESVYYENNLNVMYNNAQVSLYDLIIENNTYEAVSSCFPAGTRILMANNTTKNIEDMQAGDRIISYNPVTSEFYEAVVGELKTSINIKNLYNIELSNGTTLTLTGRHPVCTEKGTFKTVIESAYESLNIGDKIITIDGAYEVTKIEIEPYSKKYEYVYNLNIIDEDEDIYNDNDTYDTYIADGVVVHNVPMHNNC